jgi:hypothetical protein
MWHKQLPFVNPEWIANPSGAPGVTSARIGHNKQASCDAAGATAPKAGLAIAGEGRLIWHFL